MSLEVRPFVALDDVVATVVSSTWTFAVAVYFFGSTVSSPAAITTPISTPSTTGSQPRRTAVRHDMACWPVGGAVVVIDSPAVAPTSCRPSPRADVGEQILPDRTSDGPVERFQRKPANDAGRVRRGLPPGCGPARYALSSP